MAIAGHSRTEIALFMTFSPSWCSGGAAQRVKCALSIRVASTCSLQIVKSCYACGWTHARRQVLHELLLGSAPWLTASLQRFDNVSGPGHLPVSDALGVCHNGVAPQVHVHLASPCFLVLPSKPRQRRLSTCPWPTKYRARCRCRLDKRAATSIREPDMSSSRLELKSMRGQCSEAEWQTRVDLAACYRLVEHYGMSDMIANHISARVPASAARS